jgi:hypothetical protein
MQLMISAGSKARDDKGESTNGWPLSPTRSVLGGMVAELGTL